MNPILTKLLVLLSAAGIYVASTFFPSVAGPLQALAGVVGGLVLPELGKRS